MENSPKGPIDPTETSTSSSVHHDVEKGGDYSHLTNTTVTSFSWTEVNVTVKDRRSGLPKTILKDACGMIRAGEMMAVMGPSGCGKTTLLNVLAHRNVGSATVRKIRLVNGKEMAIDDFQRTSSYVEQEDALLGALTVKEILYFAAKLALPWSISKRDRMTRIEALIQAFGLQKQADDLIGTPICKGISGGEKRRVTVASQLITSPKIIFLDEPTSGLDSQAAFEVVSFIKNIAVKFNLLVIASIHQPSTSTFLLFDKLLLLSNGSTVYNDSIHSLNHYFNSIGHYMPQFINPAEYALELVNTDFVPNHDQIQSKVKDMVISWLSSKQHKALLYNIAETKRTSSKRSTIERYDQRNFGQKILIPLTLVHRSFIKSYRDVIAYGIRIAMYLGLAILMGTVWLRLEPVQGNIVPFTNAIFYGGAFMSFMAVAYIPSYLEDRMLYIKERANGLYGPISFMVANFMIGLPFLFLITVLFSTLVYWLSNFRPSATGFFTFMMWLFLDLLAAESLVVFITNICPIFVVSLAAVAFANGLWMSVNGFMVPPNTLNVFWRYVFHYIDYQAYVFQGMMVNEFAWRSYKCDNTANGDCHCLYDTRLKYKCLVDGKAVLDSYGYNPSKKGLWVGILIAIIAVYRLLALGVLYFRRT